MPQQIKVLLKEYNLPSVVSTVLQMAVTSTFVITSVVVGSVVMQTMKGFVASVASGLGFNKTQQSVKDAVSQSNVGYQKISLKVNHLLSGAIAHVVKAINTPWDAISTSVASQSYILFVSAETILLELLATSGTVASRIQDITKNLIRASVSSSTVPKSLETSRTATGTGVGSVTKRWLTEVIGFGSNVVSKVTNVATAVFFTATSEASLLKQSTLQLLALAYHTVLLESFRFRYLVLTAVSAVQSSYAKAVYKVTGVEAAASLLMVKALSRTSALTSMAVGYVVKTYNKTVNLTLSAVSFVAKQSQLLQDVVAVNTVVAIKRANLLYELAVGNVVSKVKDVVVNRVTMVMGEMATVRFYTTDTIVAVSTGVTNVVKSVPQIITAISVGFAEKMLRIGEQTFRDLISFFVRFGNRVEYNEVIRIQENPIVFDNIEVTEVQLPGIETTEVFFE